METAGPTTAAPAGYLPRIDLLRAVAVIGVVLFHLYQGVYPRAELQPLKMWADLRSHSALWRWVGAPSLFGYAGVPLFFVISGFCIHWSTLNSNKPFAYLPFMGRRFWRIYPAYVVAIAGSLILPGNPIAKTHHLRKSLLLHLLFLHNINQSTTYELSPPFWTLAVEFQFYAAYPVFLILRKWFGVMHTLTMAAVLCLVVSITVHLRFPPPAEPSHALMLPMYWVQWCLGALIAERFLKGRPPLIRLRYAVLPWLAGALFAQPISVFSEWNYLAWAIASAALTEWAIRRPRQPGRAWAPIVWIGTVSYSIYLLHAMIVGQLLPRIAAGDGKFAIGFACIVPIVIAASAVSHYAVEIPGIAVGRWVLSRCFPAKAV